MSEILADEDLMRITDENPDPAGEYSGEAAEIVRRILGRDRSDLDREYIASVVWDVFRSEFEVGIPTSDAVQLAARIEAAIG